MLFFVIFGLWKLPSSTKYMKTWSIYITNAHRNSSFSGIKAAYLKYSTEMWILTGRCEVSLQLASPWLSMWRVSALRALVRINTAREVDNSYLQTNQSTDALSSVLKVCVLLKTSNVHRGKTNATSKLEIIFDSSEFSGIWDWTSVRLFRGEYPSKFSQCGSFSAHSTGYESAVNTSGSSVRDECTCTRAERPLRALTRHHFCNRWILHKTARDIDDPTVLIRTD